MIYQFDKISLITDYYSEEDIFQYISSSQNPSDYYEFIEGQFGTLEDKRILGAVQIYNRLAVMTDRNKIKYLSFNHEEKTFQIDEELEILPGASIKDDECLWLI